MINDILEEITIIFNWLAEQWIKIKVFYETTEWFSISLKISSGVSTLISLLSKKYIATVIFAAILIALICASCNAPVTPGA